MIKSIIKPMSVVFILGLIVGFLLSKTIDVSYMVSIKNLQISGEGYIPDEKCLMKIAKAIWIPIYGTKKIMYKKYSVNLDDNNIWTIEGSPILSSFLTVHGGGPYLQIDGISGRVIEVSYTK